MLRLLRGDRTGEVNTHRTDDIVTALGLQEEFGFRLVLQHVSEAWKVADLLGGKQAMLSLILVDSPGGKEEALELFPSNAATMEEAGALVALHTDDPITDSRLFLRMAGIAVRSGMTEAGALAALTLNPARMMGLDERIGSIEPGKDADLVVLSGPPLSTWTRVEQTWVEGTKVFDRSRPADHALAVGGDAAPTPHPPETPGACPPCWPASPSLAPRSCARPAPCTPWRARSSKMAPCWGKTAASRPWAQQKRSPHRRARRSSRAPCSPPA